MKPELKARWIAALESGEYRHGKRKLRRVTDNGLEHCCLGVLISIEGFDNMDWSMYSSDPIGSLPNDIIGDLMVINDAPYTTDYSRQIEYIKEHL